MGTKIKGDIAEQAAVLHALKRGWGILRPDGDRLAYDLVFDIEGRLVKIQVKSAWKIASGSTFAVDTRRTQTNRRVMKRSKYRKEDFDFALVYIPEHDLFYVFPVNIFVGYGSEISMIESQKRQRAPQSAVYRDAWHLILQWAAHSESRA